MNTSEEKAKAPEKTKALCVATRCTSIEQFVATFHRFCDETSFFVATLATRPVGLETAFSIQLEDKTPVLRGLCVVVEAWATPANRFGRPGVRLHVKRLTNESLPVFKQLQAARIATETAERAKQDARPAEAAKADEKVDVAAKVDAPANDAAKVDAANDAAANDDDAALARANAKTEPPITHAPPPIPAPNGKPKSLAEKLAEIKAAPPKPPAIPRKPETSIPSIPSSIPKLGPTAFAVKPAVPAAAPSEQAPSPSIVIEMEIDESTKIEAKTVRAEGTAPVTRSDPSIFESTTAVKPRTFDPRHIDAKAVAKEDAKAIADAKAEAQVAEHYAGIEMKGVDAKGIEHSVVKHAPEKPAKPADKPDEKPRMTTPAIGISTSSVNLSNAAATAEDTHAQAQSYSDVPEPIAPSDDMTSPVASESRAPGSSFILPANPLMNLSDKSLEGFVDCALYEETGNFFRAPGYEDSLVDIDDVAPPPGALSPMPAIRPGDEVSQAAYVITPTMSYAPPPPQPFTQEMTPVPALRPTTIPPPYPTGQMQPLQYPQAHMQPYPPQYAQQPYAQPAYAQQPPMLAQPNAPAADRRKWMIAGVAAVVLSIVALIGVVATRGDEKTATAATPPVVEKKQPVAETKVEPPTETAAPTEQIAQTPTKEPAGKVPENTPAKQDETEEPTASDPNAPPVVGNGPCRLTVTTTPAGTIVRLDDTVMGPSPITIQSACARKRIDVKHPRYAPGQRWVVLTAEKPSNVDFVLQRPTHSVTIVTQPAGATVSIAGRRAGTSPTAVQLMGFTKVSLTIEKKGYKTVTESIYSKADGERRTVTLTRGK